MDTNGTLPRFLVPHAKTFGSIFNQPDRIYHWTFDEALKHSDKNALAMRRDCFIMGCLRERQYPTAKMKWHLEPSEPRDPAQADVADQLAKQIECIPNFRRLRMSLLEAIWYGRYGVQVTWQWTEDRGRRWLVPTNHAPVNGDKIHFDFDGIPSVMIHGASMEEYERQGARIVRTGRAMGLSLDKPQWRQRFIVHKHECDDADYFEGELAGGVHGVGVRHRIYWMDWLRREVLQWALDFTERVGQGVWVYYYEQGNADDEARVRTAANEQSRNNVVIWPRPIGNEKPGPGVEFQPVNMAGADFLTNLVNDYFDGHIRRFIVGQELSSKSSNVGLGGGSGQAELQGQTKAEIIEFDCNNLDETLTADLVGPMMRYNFPGARFKLRFVSDVGKPSPEASLNAAKIVFDMGIPIAADEVRGLANLSKPREDEETVQDTQLEHLGALAKMQESRLAGQQGQQPGMGQDEEEEGKKAPKEAFARLGDRILYASEPDANGERWITIGGEANPATGAKHEGGQPIKINASGQIVAGPAGLAAKGITHLDHFDQAKGKVGEESGRYRPNQTPARRQPHEMTLQEFDEHIQATGARDAYGKGPRGVQLAHGEAVKDAVRKGEPVPGHVLAQYPDLKGKVTQQSAAQALGYVTKPADPKITQRGEPEQEVEKDDSKVESGWSVDSELAKFREKQGAKPAAPAPAAEPAAAQPQQWTPGSLQSLHGQTVYTKDGALLPIKNDGGKWTVGGKKGLDAWTAADVLNELGADVPKALFGDDTEGPGANLKGENKLKQKQWSGKKAKSLDFSQRGPKQGDLTDSPEPAKQPQKSPITHDDDVADAWQRITGKPFDPQHLADITGIDPAAGHSVHGSTNAGDLMLQAQGPGWKAARTLRRGTNGPELTNDDIYVDPSKRGQGVAKGLQQRQIEGAKKHGVGSISAFAQKGGDNAGYKVLPRLGYDAPIPKGIAGKLPTELKGAKTLQDLMKSPGGKEWWDEHGEATNVKLGVGQPAAATTAQQTGKPAAKAKQPKQLTSHEQEAVAMGYHPDELHSAAKFVMEAEGEHTKQVAEMIKSARATYQRRFGGELTRKLKSFNGGDWVSIDGFDALTRQVVGDFPELFPGQKEATEKGYNPDETDANEKLFHLLSQGTPKLMTKQESYDSALDLLRERKEDERRNKAKADPLKGHPLGNLHGSDLHQKLYELGNARQDNPTPFKGVPRPKNAEEVSKDLMNHVTEFSKNNPFTRTTIKAAHQELQKKHPGLTIPELHGVIQDTRDAGKLRVGPFTQAVGTHPDPHYLLPLDRELKWYMEPKEDKVPFSKDPA